MDNEFTNQEEELRALTEDFTLDIDTSELWNRVEAQLPPVQNDRRRPIIWWFASGAMIAAIGIFIWSHNSDSAKNFPIVELNSNSTAEKIETKNNR